MRRRDVFIVVAVQERQRSGILVFAKTERAAPEELEWSSKRNDLRRSLNRLRNDKVHHIFEASVPRILFALPRSACASIQDFVNLCGNLIPFVVLLKRRS